MTDALHEPAVGEPVAESLKEISDELRRVNHTLSVLCALASTYMTATRVINEEQGQYFIDQLFRKGSQ